VCVCVCVCVCVQLEPTNFSRLFNDPDAQIGARRLAKLLDSDGGSQPGRTAWKNPTAECTGGQCGSTDWGVECTNTQTTRPERSSERAYAVHRSTRESVKIRAK
jgi:hypothetical protein